MSDIFVQCCRCRNKHLESERPGRSHKTIPGMKNLVCPRCGAESYYKLDDPQRDRRTRLSSKQGGGVSDAQAGRGG